MFNFWRKLNILRISNFVEKIPDIDSKGTLIIDLFGTNQLAFSVLQPRMYCAASQKS